MTESEGPVDRSDIVKGYEYSKGKYVVLEPKELKKFRIPTKRAIEVRQFVNQDDIDFGVSYEVKESVQWRSASTRARSSLRRNVVSSHTSRTGTFSAGLEIDLARRGPLGLCYTQRAFFFR